MNPLVEKEPWRETLLLRFRNICFPNMIDRADRQVYRSLSHFRLDTATIVHNVAIFYGGMIISRILHEWISNIFLQNIALMPIRLVQCNKIVCVNWTKFNCVQIAIGDGINEKRTKIGFACHAILDTSWSTLMQKVSHIGQQRQVQQHSFIPFLDDVKLHHLKN